MGLREILNAHTTRLREHNSIGEHYFSQHILLILILSNPCFPFYLTRILSNPSYFPYLLFTCSLLLGPIITPPARPTSQSVSFPHRLVPYLNDCPYTISSTPSSSSVASLLRCHSSQHSHHTLRQV